MTFFEGSGKVKIGSVTVLVKEGNILTEDCDAIVNSTNDNLDLSKGYYISVFSYDIILMFFLSFCLSFPLSMYWD